MRDREGLQLAAIADGHVLAGDKAVRVQAVARFVVGARPVIVIDDPGGAVRSAGPMNEAAVTGGFAGPEAPDSAPVPCLAPALGVEMAGCVEGRNQVVAVEGTALRVFGTA